MNCEKITKLLATLWTSLAFTSIAFAQTETPASHTAPAVEMKQTGQATVLTGKVKSVDPKAGKLTIKTNDREIRLTADSKTTRAALDKLKIGDTARVFEKGGKVIAASPVNTDSKPKGAK